MLNGRSHKHLPIERRMFNFVLWFRFCSRAREELLVLQLRPRADYIDRLLQRRLPRISLRELRRSITRSLRICGIGSKAIGNARGILDQHTRTFDDEYTIAGKLPVFATYAISDISYDRIHLGIPIFIFFWIFQLFYYTFFIIT